MDGNWGQSKIYSTYGATPNGSRIIFTLTPFILPYPVINPNPVYLAEPSLCKLLIVSLFFVLMNLDADMMQV